uniref:DUF4430 domain-containing protein n=1 Tax=Esox lucius TaxID=8010 RepID=A0AAY5K2X7_ESOLU
MSPSRSKQGGRGRQQWMRMMTSATFLSAALLLLIPGIMSTESLNTDSIQLLIFNSISPTPNMTYTVDIGYRWILIGAMRRLQEICPDFRFTYTEHPRYGPFLVSVNDLAGDTGKHTYWELLVETRNGTTIRPDVGIGCYIPNPKETIILKFTRWGTFR